MWKKKLVCCFAVWFTGVLQAQTVWPAVQSNMYPYIPNMKLVRHEQTVLLGEGNQQTGIFYSTLGDTYSEQVSNELINDALLKSWSLHSLVRLGTSFVLTFVQETRILDIRLINSPQGVDAIYSIVLNQTNGKPKLTPVSQNMAVEKAAE